MRRASRYDAVIATLVGFCALCVSAYTAYVQRQQVRAAVWPILEFDSSNAPDIHFTLAMAHAQEKTKEQDRDKGHNLREAQSMLEAEIHFGRQALCGGPR